MEYPSESEINQEIALNLPLESLSSFCWTSKDLSNICRSNDFWRDKLHRDYPDLPFEKNLLEQGESYYTINGIDYRALYSVSHLLYPLVQAGRRQLEQILTLDPNRGANYVFFLSPHFPYSLWYEDNEKGNRVNSTTQLMIEGDGSYTNETVPWLISYQEGDKPYSAKNLDAGVMFYLDFNLAKRTRTETGVGNIRAAADFLLRKGFIPFDNKILFSKQQLARNYNYFAIDKKQIAGYHVDRSKQTVTGKQYSTFNKWDYLSSGGDIWSILPIPRREYETALENLPEDLRQYKGQKSSQTTRRLVEELGEDDLSKFAFSSTQLLEYTREYPSLWDRFIKRDFPPLHNRALPSINDHKLYSLLWQLDLQDQEPLQTFLTKFRKVLSRGTRDSAMLQKEQLRQKQSPNANRPDVDIVYLVKSTLPLRIHKKDKDSYLLADAVKLVYSISPIPGSSRSHYYRIEVTKEFEQNAGEDFPYLPENDPAELLDWLDDLELNYLCFAPQALAAQYVVDDQGVVNVPSVVLV